MHELWKYGDNYGGACVSSLIGNPGSPVVQQGLSDGNRIHKAQTGGRAAHAPSLRHPFLPHARNQNTCAAGRSSSSMQVHRWANGARLRADAVAYTVTFPESPSRPRSRQLHSLSGLWSGSICHHWSSTSIRFPALDANAEITPCDPLDRLSGV